MKIARHRAGSHSSRLLAFAALLACALLFHATPAEALDPGTNAVVRADGDCLRLRAQPTTAGTTLTCIPEGTTVRVLAGTVGPIDGFRWQRIAYGTQEGWSVEQYLVAAGTASPPAATPPPTTAPPAAAPVPTPPPAPLVTPSLTGTVPANGGFGLVVWGGGPIDRIPAVAGPQGCSVRAIWQTRGGEFIGYVYGAPAIVNSSWNAQFADGTLPANTALILVCASGASTPPSTPPPSSTPSSTPSGPAATPSLPPGTPATPPGPAGNG